eukprot:1159852-Pelagomonas_calceolata.AAC.11
MGCWWSGVGSDGDGQASRGMDDIRRVEGGACGLGAGQGVHIMYFKGAQQTAAGHGFPWLERLKLLTLLVKGLGLQSFSYHLALFLVAGP